MVVVALHSALESYAKAIGAADRGPMPKSVVNFLSASAPLPSSLADELTEFDQTRHLVIHHSGVVSDRYVNAVKYNTLAEGELRSISSSNLTRYAEMVWIVADVLRTSATQQE
jgi:hypothetical protein